MRRSGAVAGLGMAGAAACLSGGGHARAQAPAVLTREQVRTLVLVCRDIYPHDQIADAIYEQVVGDFDARAAGDSELARVFAEGLRDLDVAARSVAGRRYVDVVADRTRSLVLERLQSGDFFQVVRGGLVRGLYGNPAVWKALGYEGPSARFGGYLTRGFDDIDWL
ncbi:MAG: hypothetical protein GC151_07990 [Betaproteobacteria bacterium]|nr:hypothetical protein [Betaproteobacteria bacterium]